MIKFLLKSYCFLVDVLYFIVFQFCMSFGEVRPDLPRRIQGFGGSSLHQGLLGQPLRVEKTQSELTLSERT